MPPLEILEEDERKVLLQMIQIEDQGHGGYRIDSDLEYRLVSKGLVDKFACDKASPEARRLLSMPKPPPSAEEIDTLRRWIDEGSATGWQLAALERRGLVDPFGKPTDAGRIALI